MTEYPDISEHQRGMNISGPPFLVLRAAFHSTKDKAIDEFLASAERNGQLVGCYQWLSPSDIPGQARAGFRHSGGRPMMMDIEERVSPASIIEYANTYRSLGGVCNLVYYPRWKWVENGRPDLAPLANAGLQLVSSSYTFGNEGWQPYGGMTPVIWQFTGDGKGETRDFNGHTNLDWNRYRGSFDELMNVWGTAAADQGSMVQFLH